MDDKKVERNLRSVGKECFVTYFELFKGPLSNQAVAERLREECGYTWNACQSRTSTSRSIIRAGRAKDALGNVRDSERVPQRIRDKAARLAARQP